MNQDSEQVIILLLVRNGQLLLEKRSFSGADHFLPPGGRVKIAELNNLEQSLVREAKEELGITPLEFKAILQTEDFISELGKLLKPYVVTKWKGDIPQSVLDTGAQLSWQSFEQALNSPLESIRIMAKEAQKAISTSGKL